jgi:hypothetical protein
MKINGHTIIVIDKNLMTVGLNDPIAESIVQDIELSALISMQTKGCLGLPLPDHVDTSRRLVDEDGNDTQVAVSIAAYRLIEMDEPLEMYKLFQVGLFGIKASLFTHLNREPLLHLAVRTYTEGPFPRSNWEGPSPRARTTLSVLYLAGMLGPVYCSAEGAQHELPVHFADTRELQQLLSYESRIPDNLAELVAAVKRLSTFENLSRALLGWQTLWALILDPGEPGLFVLDKELGEKSVEGFEAFLATLEDEPVLRQFFEERWSKATVAHFFIQRHLGAAVLPGAIRDEAVDRLKTTAAARGLKDVDFKELRDRLSLSDASALEWIKHFEGQFDLVLRHHQPGNTLRFPLCKVCGRRGKGLCSGCLERRYCSKLCQVSVESVIFF